MLTDVWSKIWSLLRTNCIVVREAYDKKAKQIVLFFKILFESRKYKEEAVLIYCNIYI